VDQMHIVLDGDSDALKILRLLVRVTRWLSG